MADEVDRRPIEQRIAAVRAQEEAGDLPVGQGEAKSWTCPECGEATTDPQEGLQHRALHPPADLSEKGDAPQKG